VASKDRITEIIDAGMRAVNSKARYPWNRIKEDPRNHSLRQLLSFVKEEVEELEEALNELPLDDLEVDRSTVEGSIKKCITWKDIIKDKKYRPAIMHIISEVADVAFFSSMIADWVERTDMERVENDHTKRNR